MYRHTLPLLFVLSLGACASTTAGPVTEEAVAAKAAELDFGDYSSSTLTNKAWEALNDEDYPAVLAHTKETVSRYGEEGRRMNSEMTDFAPSGSEYDPWALNDVGTSLFIMGKAYGALKMHGAAATAYEELIADYGYAQCWDPKGWFWRPAEAAIHPAKRHRELADAFE